MKPKIIAFHLPQYHPFPENDEWWGKGFTEWTNVGKAKPLFKGHYQPKVPADLGYYDLRLPEVRELQAEYARRAGIEGFCFYHYWFGNKELMQKPFDEIVRLKQPDFPFCLCWANESWHNKFWNHDGKIEKKLLIEQKYLGKEDNEKHFYRLLDAFNDTRYIKHEGKLIFVIYNPLSFKDVSEYMDQWNDLARKNGLNSFFFIGYCTKRENIEPILNLGFDAVNFNRLAYTRPLEGSLNEILEKIRIKVFHRPLIISYNKAVEVLDGIEDEDEKIIPSLVPNWDHTPRSGYAGYLLNNSTPSLFSKHISRVLKHVDKKQNKLVFLKSWNEWGEGNYMEPDLIFGCQYIDALKKELTKY